MWSATHFGAIAVCASGSVAAALLAGLLPHHGALPLAAESSFDGTLASHAPLTSAAELQPRHTALIRVTRNV